MKINMNIPDYLLELVIAEAEQDEIPRNAVIIAALKARYSKRLPDAIKSKEFWPSGWPRHYELPVYEYAGVTRGPHCNKCSREHDPMEHEDNDASTLETVIRRYEQAQG